MDKITCVICDNEFAQGHWTDSHGIAICAHCGSPYRILHRDDSGKLMDKPPTCCIDETWIDRVREYRSKNPDRLIPSGCNMPGSSYEMCSEEDFRTWNEHFAEPKGSGNG